MKKIEIIQASLEHVEVLTPLFDGYRQFYKQPSNLEGARRFLSERLANKESVIFLASNEEEGLGFIQLYPTFSSIVLKRMWILNDLYVLPDARRQGVDLGPDHGGRFVYEVNGLVGQKAIGDISV